MNNLSMAQGTEAKDRHTYIGGSNMADLMGLEPYGCLLRMYLKKCRFKESNPTPPKPVMKRGIYLEGGCADWVRDDVGLQLSIVTEENSIVDAAVAESLPALHAHPDRWIHPPTEEAWRRLGGTGSPPTGHGIHEIKTCTPEAFDAIVKSGGQLGHFGQVHANMLKTGLQWAVLSAHDTSRWKHVYYLIHRDGTVDALITALVQTHWGAIQKANAVLGAYRGPDGIVEQPFPAMFELMADLEFPPRLDPTDSRCEDCAFRRACQGEKVLQFVADDDGTFAKMDDDPRWGMAVAAYLAAKDFEKQAKAQLEEAKAELQAQMGDRPAAIGGGIKVHYRPQVAHRINADKLRADFPEAAAACEFESVSRPFRAYKQKK